MDERSIGEVDVVVVGAGLAGLRAAVDLASGGLDVVVVEARDRVGGRVFSHRFEDGQVAERGAEFVDADHTEVLGLAAELGLAVSVRPVPEQPGLLDAAGQLVPLTESHHDELDRWWSQVASGERSATDSLASTIASVDSPMSRLVIGREARTEFMLPPDEVSHSFAAHVVGVRQWSGAERHRIVGGNDQLAVGLAARLGPRLRLNCPAEAIDAQRGIVRLRSGEELRATNVIAAVPIPVLVGLSELPDSMARWGFGVGGKVSIQFDRRVWRDLGFSGTVLSDRSWGHLWETTDDQPGDRGILTNLAASHDGAIHAALPGAASRMVSEIERLFGGARRWAGAAVTTDWSNDPATLGTYLCLHPGQVDGWRRRPERHGRMWFAGEHMDDRCGFMEGALRSGRRVAASILGH